MIQHISRWTAICLGFCVLAIGIAHAEQQAVEISNEFIRVYVNPGPEEAGRFSMKTTNGDPSRPRSRDRHLIFGGPSPWTSYTTVRIDGANYVFGGMTTRRAGSKAHYGEITEAPRLDDEQQRIICAGKYGDLLVTQELGFARGASTRMLDSARITYRITNQGDAPHTVGVRVMLDTMLGSNDGAPVRAGNDAITMAKYLAGEQLPDYWQAFDSLTNPTIVSQGTLCGGDVSRPDRILFADWGTLADEAWMPELEAGQSFIRKGEIDPDTATAIFWMPATIDPGTTRVFTTHYGIGDVSLKAGQLALGITAPAEAEFLYERTAPLTITGYVQNAGGFVARDMKVTFTLPEGLHLVTGTLTERFAEFHPGDIVQRRWVVRPDGKFAGAAKVALAVSSANVEANAMERAIDLTVPAPRVIFSPAQQSISYKASRIKPVLAQIALTPAVEFHGVRLTMEYNPTVISPIDISRGRAFVENDTLLDGWDFAYEELGVLTISGERRNAKSLTQAEAHLATLKFRVVAPGDTELRLVRAVLIDKDGKESPLEINHGKIEVTGDAE